MDYVYVGKLVNTHGLKGEVKLISNFEYKERAFIPNNKVYIDNEELTISSYRHHKIFDMLTFKEYNYINDVLKFKGKKVYIKKSSLKLKDDEFLLTDYIGLNAYYNNEFIGKISDIIDNNGYKLFKLNNKYIPFNKEFIKNIDIEKKIIEFKNMEGLL